jgi:carbon-monoxide dehydrogenase small subunit
MEITIRINERDYKLDVDPQDSLLIILREELHLTGTKNGCDNGHCGTCTVIMNGKAVKSCLIRAKKIPENSNIITIEGLSDNYKLHPIQEAFVKTTAVQCGFCTPGYIMELYALFEEDPYANEVRIREVLEGHLCRCTGYRPVLDAALLAKNLLQEKKN